MEFSHSLFCFKCTYCYRYITMNNFSPLVTGSVGIATYNQYLLILNINISNVLTSTSLTRNVV